MLSMHCVAHSQFHEEKIISVCVCVVLGEVVSREESVGSSAGQCCP